MSTQKCKICDSNATEEPCTRDSATINRTHCGKYFTSTSLLIENYLNHLAFYRIQERHNEFKVTL